MLIEGIHCLLQALLVNKSIINAIGNGDLKRYCNSHKVFITILLAAISVVYTKLIF